MIRDTYRYVKQVVRGEQFLKDTENQYRFVGQSPYKGNPEKGLKPGSRVTVQVLVDNSDPVLDKETHAPKDNNVLETFEATIVGVDYPLPFQKGDYVALENFLEDASYYINFSLILRFGGIRLLKRPQPKGGTANAATGQTK